MKSMTLTSDFGNMKFGFEENSTTPILESSSSKKMSLSKNMLLTLNFQDVETVRAEVGKHVIKIVLEDDRGK